MRQKKMQVSMPPSFNDIAIQAIPSPDYPSPDLNMGSDAAKKPSTTPSTTLYQPNARRERHGNRVICLNANGLDTCMRALAVVVSCRPSWPRRGNA
jgi:hypothetical protein